VELLFILLQAGEPSKVNFEFLAWIDVAALQFGGHDVFERGRLDNIGQSGIQVIFVDGDVLVVFMGVAPMTVTSLDAIDAAATPLQAAWLLGSAGTSLDADKVTSARSVFLERRARAIRLVGFFIA
jgi:hypothetical protein